MPNLAQDIKTNKNEKAVCFKCGRELDCGRGMSSHQRECIKTPHTSFIYNSQVLTRTIHIGDIILCFKKDAQYAYDWFYKNWGDVYSITKLKEAIGKKIDTQKKVKRPGITVDFEELRKFASCHAYFARGDGDVIINSPIYDECLDSLNWCIEQGYKPYFDIMFPNEKKDYTAPRQKDKIKQIEIQTPQVRVEDNNFHTHPETETICISPDQYETLKELDMIDVFKIKHKAENINIDMMN